MIRYLNIPTTLRLLTLSLALLCCLGAEAGGQTVTRTLTGQVVDRQHEPLRGAVVVIQQEGTENVTSYLTDKEGHFSFKRLSSSVDYKVTATYRGKTCHAKELSHFDSKMQTSLVFVIKLD